MLQRYAVTLASLTFLLIVWGGVVHNTRSSLACPDWPLCFGQVMPEMKDGVLIEHSHRMLGTTVGAMTVLLAFALWRRKEKLGRLGLVAVVAVSLQGLLGGLTVIYRLPTWVSTAHLGLAMLFLALILFFIVRLGVRRVPLSERSQRAAAIGAAVVYSQILIGAYIRHAGAGLACVDWPLCRGALFPADGNAYLDLHMMHRLLGVVVLGVVIWVVAKVWRETASRLSLRVLVLLLPVLVAVQIALGLWSIATFLAVEPVTLHLAVAAMIFASLVVLSFVARGVGSTESEVVRA